MPEAHSLPVTQRSTSSDEERERKQLRRPTRHPRRKTWQEEPRRSKSEQNLGQNYFGEIDTSDEDTMPEAHRSRTPVTQRSTSSEEEFEERERNQLHRPTRHPQRKSWQEEPRRSKSEQNLGQNYFGEIDTSDEDTMPEAHWSRTPVTQRSTSSEEECEEVEEEERKLRRPTRQSRRKSWQDSHRGHSERNLGQNDEQPTMREAIERLQTAKQQVVQVRKNENDDLFTMFRFSHYRTSMNTNWTLKEKNLQRCSDASL